VKIHEYQAKEILGRFGVPIPRWKIARSSEDAVRAARELGGEAWVLKAQVHAGGRGKGGGVKLCRSLEDLRAAADKMLASRLVTPQTGPEGCVVRKLMVTEICAFDREFYVGIVLDRRLSLPVLMASAEGGVEIEEVAARSPEKIIRQPFSAIRGLQPHMGRKLAVQLGLPSEQVGSASGLFTALARAFLETDASLAEINPLALTREGKLVALDAKWVLDDNALFRHPALREYRDVGEEDPQETRAAQFDLSYIKLDGNVGCLVNGAGLAMSTMDIIQYWGGRPANFLDVGGGATEEKVTEAFKIILEDPNVKAILVNIFGGIMKCDIIAAGIMAAAKSVALRVPLVVRLEGTNVDRGKAMLKESGLAIVLADDLSDAARKVVAHAGGAKS
jgi:succinyl-CoA synthetase beta subunit